MMSSFPLMDIDENLEEAMNGLVRAKRVVEELCWVRADRSNAEVFAELDNAPEFKPLFEAIDQAWALVSRVWPGSFEDALKSEQAMYDEMERRADANSYY
jgi:hypothetical protein